MAAGRPSKVLVTSEPTIAEPEDLRSLGPRDKTSRLWPEVRSWDRSLEVRPLFPGPQSGESPSLLALWPVAVSGDMLWGTAALGNLLPQGAAVELQMFSGISSIKAKIDEFLWDEL